MTEEEFYLKGTYVPRHRQGYQIYGWKYGYGMIELMTS